jgi:hypothetical protein
MRAFKYAIVFLCRLRLSASTKKKHLTERSGAFEVIETNSTCLQFIMKQARDASSLSQTCRNN